MNGAAAMICRVVVAVRQYGVPVVDAGQGVPPALGRLTLEGDSATAKQGKP